MGHSARATLYSLGRVLRLCGFVFHASDDRLREYVYPHEALSGHEDYRWWAFVECAYLLFSVTLWRGL